MNKLAVLVIFAMIGAASAETCNVPGSGCNEQGWGSPNCGGGYGGFDGVGCSGCAMIVAPGSCDGSDDSASVDFGDGSTVRLTVTSDPTGWGYCEGYGHLAVNLIEKTDTQIRVRYLDGFDDDAFDVYKDDVYVCSIVMQQDGKETWETAVCDLPTIPLPENKAVIVLALLCPAVAAAFVVRKKGE